MRVRLSLWRLRCPRPSGEYLLKRRAHDRKPNELSETLTSAPDPNEPRENYFLKEEKRGEPSELPANGTSAGRGMNKEGGGEKRITPPQRAAL